MKRQTFVPTALGPLEHRVTPSQLTAAAIAIGNPHHHHIALNGVVQGTDVVLGDTNILRANGQVAPLGHVRAAGGLQIRGGEPTFYNGGLVLRNSTGFVVLRLHGIEGGPSAGHTKLTYDIVFGGGDYLGATGHGTAFFETGGPLLASGTTTTPATTPLVGNSDSFAIAFGKATPPVLPLGTAGLTTTG